MGTGLGPLGLSETGLVIAPQPCATIQCQGSLNFPADAAEWTEKEVDLFIGH